MATDTEVLKEFLVSLKWAVDESSVKKMLDRLKLTEAAAFRVSKGVLAIGAAAQAMVLAVSYEFERLYYASKRIGDTAAHIQAAKFGAAQIGISAETMEGALAQMASTMRTNPGMSALFQSLTGARPGGTVQSMIELVKRLQQMPYFVAAQWAQKFGISEDMLNMLLQPGALDEMQAKAREREAINERLGLNTDELASKSRDYMNTVRELTTNAGSLAGLLANTLIPAFKGMNTAIEELIQFMTGAKVKAPIQKDAQGNSLPPVGPGASGPTKPPTYGESIIERTFDMINPAWRNLVGKKAPDGSVSGKIIREGGNDPLSQVMRERGLSFGEDPEIGDWDAGNRKTAGMSKEDRRAWLKQGTGVDETFAQLRAAGAPDADIARALKALGGGAGGRGSITINAPVTNNIQTSGDPSSVGNAAGRGTVTGISTAIRNAQPILNAGGG